MKIDIDKFICDFMSFEYKMDEDESPFKDWSRNQRKLIIGIFWLLAKDIKQSLRKQGLEYKNGEIQSIDSKSTIIKFEEEPDIDGMVEDYRKSLMDKYGYHSDYIPIDGLCVAYGLGLEDMYRLLKGGIRNEQDLY